jgi:anaerobic selenocysteine-containing dehydrogenase
MASAFCRLCMNHCPIVVEVDDGRAVGVRGDPRNPVWGGHTCIKGRTQHLRLEHPDRLLHSLRRRADGTYEPIEVEQAMDEIAERVSALVAARGPSALAAYLGTSLQSNPTWGPLIDAFMRGLGSPMLFTPMTIDKPGKNIARALLGSWMAPPRGHHEPDAILMVGVNPLVSYTGLPSGSPRWLIDRLKRGMRLVVIDPRRTEIARRATVHLQVRPGHDAFVLAALLRVLLEERRYDEAFVAGDVAGIERLERAVRPFTPELVARLAGVEPDQIRCAARAFGPSRSGYVFAGTGPSMSGPGTLNEYLCLVLDTICGHWQRAGEAVANAPVLLPTPAYRAQAAPARPARGYGVTMRVRGLTETPAGLPTAAVADEILLEGEGQIGALISCGGNPASAWPDQEKVVRALGKLDLLVQVDPWMSATAQLADYVIAPRLPLETIGTTLQLDFVAGHAAGYGVVEAFGRYTPPVVEPPPGSDLIEEWELFYGLARRLGIGLEVAPTLGFLNSAAALDARALDMDDKPTTEALLELLLAGGRVPLEEVRRHELGAWYGEPPVRVAPKEPGWPHRLDVAADDMMAELEALAGSLAAVPSHDAEFPLRLVCRRVKGMVNSTVNDGIGTRGVRHNPAYLHPDDLRALRLEEGDLVELRSRRAAILGIVAADNALRRGVVSMTHAYGGLAVAVDLETQQAGGSNPARLIADDAEFDRYSGQPRMSDVPVAIRRISDRVPGAAPAGR